MDTLQDVFREIYNFHTTCLLLRQDEPRLMQVQIMKGLADFIFEQDGPYTLLIVYYAGHAIRGDVREGSELTRSVYICNLKQSRC